VTVKQLCVSYSDNINLFNRFCLAVILESFVLLTVVLLCFHITAISMICSLLIVCNTGSLFIGHLIIILLFIQDKEFG